jgi:hypothetical protein
MEHIEASHLGRGGCVCGYYERCSLSLRVLAGSSGSIGVLLNGRVSVSASWVYGGYQWAVDEAEDVWRDINVRTLGKGAV